MAKQFNSLKAFSKHLDKVIKKYPQQEKAFLTTVGRFIEKESKSYIGHLQTTWQELAESTKDQKESLGYGDAGNDWQPLLRTGDMRDSIHYAVQLHDVYIGSDSDILVYQELGTARMPARPVLGLAMYSNKKKLTKAVGNFMYSWISDTRLQGKIT